MVVDQEVQTKGAFRVGDAVGLSRPEYIFAVQWSGFCFWEMKDSDL